VVKRVPVHQLVAIVTGTLVLFGGALAVVIPRIKESKQAGVQRRNRAGADLVARERLRLRVDQRLHVGALASTPAAERELVAGLERAITADGRARLRHRTLDGPLRATTCRPHRRAPAPTGPSPATAAVSLRLAVQGAGFDCVLLTTSAPGRPRPAVGGYPFRARIDLAHRRYEWCKVSPALAEGGAASELARVDLPPVCDLDR
jgi:hypothetical protein